MTNNQSSLPLLPVCGLIISTPINVIGIIMIEIMNELPELGKLFANSLHMSVKGLKLAIASGDTSVEMLYEELGISSEASHEEIVEAMKNKIKGEKSSIIIQ